MPGRLCTTEVYRAVLPPLCRSCAAAIEPVLQSHAVALEPASPTYDQTTGDLAGYAVRVCTRCAHYFSVTYLWRRDRYCLDCVCAAIRDAPPPLLTPLEQRRAAAALVILAIIAALLYVNMTVL